MKRCFILLITFLFIVPLCACTQNQSLPTQTVNFYYKSDPIIHGVGTQSGTITVEARDIIRTADDIPSIIEQYLNGPRKSHCIMPFPAGTRLVQYNQVNNSAQILLSKHASLISGNELLLSCVCLGQTVLELTDFSSVQISAEGSLLNGQQSITITPNNYVLFDVSD